MLRMCLLKVGTGTYESAGLWLDSNPSKFQLIRVEGLNPPPGRLNWSNIAGHDGSVYKSGTTATRNIVITVSLTGTDAEATRQRLYYYFTPENNIWMKIIPNEGGQELEIRGYVDSVENSPFGNGQTIQASIICPNPYFNAMLDAWVTAGEEFTNSESVPAGYVIQFQATEAMPNGVSFVFKVGQTETGRITVSKALSAGDNVEVRHNFVTADEVLVNDDRALGFLPWDFEWPELEPGKTYTYEVEGFAGTSNNPNMSLRLYRAGV